MTKEDITVNVDGSIVQPKKKELTEASIIDNIGYRSFDQSINLINNWFIFTILIEKAITVNIAKRIKNTLLNIYFFSI